MKKACVKCWWNRPLLANTSVIMYLNVTNGITTTLKVMLKPFLAKKTINFLKTWSPILKFKFTRMTVVVRFQWFLTSIARWILSILYLYQSRFNCLSHLVLTLNHVDQGFSTCVATPWLRTTGIDQCHLQSGLRTIRVPQLCLQPLLWLKTYCVCRGFEPS